MLRMNLLHSKDIGALAIVLIAAIGAGIALYFNYLHQIELVKLKEEQEEAVMRIKNKWSLLAGRYCRQAPTICIE